MVVAGAVGVEGEEGVVGVLVAAVKTEYNFVKVNIAIKIPLLCRSSNSNIVYNSSKVAVVVAAMQ